MLKKTAIAFVLTAAAFLSYAENKEDISGGWVLSQQWCGYMGVAILFDKDEYTYWGYSDVNYPGKPRYPIKGKYSIEDNKITLDNTRGTYSDKWYLIDYQSERWLIPDNEYSKLAKGKPFDDSRLLHFDKFFDAEDPFAYQQGYKTPEQRRGHLEYIQKEKQALIKDADKEAKKKLDEFNASENSKKLGGPLTIDDYEKKVSREVFDVELSNMVDIVSYTLKRPVDFNGYPRSFSIKMYRDDDFNLKFILVKGKPE